MVLPLNLSLSLFVTAAHDDGIWAVAWAKNERNDCLVTGSVDDTVRTWYWCVVAVHAQTIDCAGQ